MLRRLTILSVFSLLILTMSGCLIIGAKDSNVRDRVAVVESRLDHLERINGVTPPPQQTGYTDGFATTTQMAEMRSGSRVVPR